MSKGCKNVDCFDQHEIRCCYCIINEIHGQLRTKVGCKTKTNFPTKKKTLEGEKNPKPFSRSNQFSRSKLASLLPDSIVHFSLLFQKHFEFLAARFQFG
jgi:hypothetical protein